MYMQISFPTKNLDNHSPKTLSPDSRGFQVSTQQMARHYWWRNKIMTIVCFIILGGLVWGLGWWAYKEIFGEGPKVIEKEVIREVPVEKIVEKEVPVEKEGEKEGEKEEEKDEEKKPEKE
jgi:hypothetical protein